MKAPTGPKDDESHTTGSTPPSAVSHGDGRSNSTAGPSSAPGPITHLPPELWIAVLSHLEHDELVPLRLVNRQLSTLALAPCLHRRLTLFPPLVLTPVLRKILPHVRHLSVHLAGSPRGWGALASSSHGARNPLFPSSYIDGVRPARCSSPHPSTSLRALLALIHPGQLRALHLPHAAVPWDELAPELARIGGKLHTLDLRGGGLAHSAARALPVHLRDLNLSYNCITRLPRISSLQRLEVLTLRGCFMIPMPEVARLLSNLPETVHTLDLSEMQQVEVPALMALRVASDPGPSALKCVKLAGIDHLTRADVRALQRHWAERRAACRGEEAPRAIQLLTPPPSPPSSFLSGSPERSAFHTPTMMPATPPTRWLPHATPRKLPPTPPESAKRPHDDDHINIVHTALLESDDEAGYRQFIGEVVGGTLGLGIGGPLAEAGA
ncbi:uncharacterized protein LOC62_01G001080 [Vanrija pseudolonga]|uniref:F-box domain-containing protein n=1 Tax=Vanrija pseudolonga TaxID=143232 RepID=A0AAF1BF36_9TREE|nr:hypothetical protein LOC62_01G001080 [Vanrija pseudolonga]